ncbi:membrane-spanning 4-domains subfamily A member 15-like [Lonchura striata]
MPVTPAHPGSSATGEAAPGLEPLLEDFGSLQSRLVEQEGPDGNSMRRGGGRQLGVPSASWARSQAVAATTVTDAANVRIITEVIPATDPQAAQLASGSQAPARTSFQTHGFQRAHPRVFGIIHIFTGIVHICFGIILTLSEHSNPSLPVASGTLFWLGILLLVSGSLLVESERRDSPVLVKTCCVVNVGVVLGTLVATGIHGTAISRVLPGCEEPEPFQTLPEWCLSMESKMLSNGLDSTLVLLILLEFCVAVAVLAFGYDAVRQQTYTQLAL